MVVPNKKMTVPLNRLKKKKWEDNKRLKQKLKGNKEKPRIEKSPSVKRRRMLRELGRSNKKRRKGRDLSLSNKNKKDWCNKKLKCKNNKKWCTNNKWCNNNKSKRGKTNNISCEMGRTETMMRMKIQEECMITWNHLALKEEAVPLLKKQRRWCKMMMKMMLDLKKTQDQKSKWIELEENKRKPQVVPLLVEMEAEDQMPN